MSSINLENVNVLAEFEHYKIKFEFTGDSDELKTTCPFHLDENPSCFVNISKKSFCCHTAGCEKHGEIISFLAAKTKISRAQIVIELAQRYSLDGEEQQVIDFRTVERFYATEMPEILRNELYKRGITDEDIKFHRIGYDISTKRITIPIRNREGLFVNVRKYLPGAPGAEKFKNSKGHGKVRLCPVEQLKYEH